ncbi:hypothetical protein PTTG_28613 [Puccinia triticina 1-1 BBBD Race 1]|uniref:Uncharacterized protein n=1 Tax=Puccinia triticina (isolate 1-1 / race 1 (BBBD)) TaxID=630390 RepID=A0A180GAH6_PUCT1|nr:hypothetical protein PTTG_28613 [Puccinia triticina 1-1 BBBD Race 1]
MTAQNLSYTTFCYSYRTCSLSFAMFFRSLTPSLVALIVGSFCLVASKINAYSVPKEKVNWSNHPSVPSKDTRDSSNYTSTPPSKDSKGSANTTTFTLPHGLGTFDIFGEPAAVKCQ